MSGTTWPRTTGGSVVSGRPWTSTERTFEDRRRILGASDPRTLVSYNAVARDLRGLGLYQESLDIARKVVGAFAAAGGRENPDWLNARTGFAAALRKAGHHWDALQESEDVVQRYRDYLGPDHTDTLRAATNLINDRRAVGDLVRAEELGRGGPRSVPESRLPFDIVLRGPGQPGVRAARGRTPGGGAAIRPAGQGRAYRDLRRPASVHPGGEHQLRFRPGRVR